MPGQASCMSTRRRKEIRTIRSRVRKTRNCTGNINRWPTRPTACISSDGWPPISTTTWTKLWHRPCPFARRSQACVDSNWSTPSHPWSASRARCSLRMERKITMELWAGVECTVNRVGDRYFDQLIKNGHDRRLEDLSRFADLGITALRYPVLWERTAPDGLRSARWDWADERLERLRALGIRPIVGLLHHGSGPKSTRLE